VGIRRRGGRAGPVRGHRAGGCGRHGRAGETAVGVLRAARLAGNPDPAAAAGQRSWRRAADHPGRQAGGWTA